MFLIRRQYGRSVQMHDLCINSALLGMVHDGNFEVYRFRNGRFERLFAVTEERPPSKCLFWKADWRELPVESR